MNISHMIAKKTGSEAHVYVLGVGGTISCSLSGQSEEFYHHPSIPINELIDTLGINKKNITITSEQFSQQISHEMTANDLLNLARRINELANIETIDGIVITHGTNALEEAAYFVNLVVKTKKPIIFTGAMRPSNALGFDGLRNLYNAILLGADRNMRELGVLVTFNDCIVSARDAIKFNPVLVGDFTMGNQGVMGWIQRDRIHLQKKTTHKHTYLSEFNINKINSLPKIFMIYGHLGIDKAFVDAAISSNANGIISIGMGKGYQPKELTEALKEASQKGIFIVRCSRAGQGMIHREPALDDETGFIAGGSLTPQKASMLLSVTLSATKDRKKIQRMFEEY